MSHYYSYIHSAKDILTAYYGKEPFSYFIKKQLAAHKKYGSRDRKQITHLCYCFFRLGKSFADAGVEERIIIALFLCSTATNEMLQNLKPEWNEKVKLSFNEKIKLITYPFNINQLFPFNEELSNGIHPETFAISHLTQPDLFLRIRPGFKETVMHKLQAAGFTFQIENENCISLSNSLKVDDVLQINKEAVVQDYSSQKVGDSFKMINFQSSPHNYSVWDCCAASGGKSIMAYDLLPGIQLTVSDVRETILTNLKKRFSAAGIKSYASFVGDLSKPLKQLAQQKKQYHLIIADVPCSGSGTWGRTPEQLQFFNEKKVDEYVNLQKKIVSNVIPFLKQDGYLLYSTCSVFKNENEEVVAFVQETFQLQLIEMNVLKGYDKKADSLFVAVLKKK